MTGGPVAGAHALLPEAPAVTCSPGPRLTAGDVERLLEGGRALGHELAGAGLVALGEVGVGNTTLAAALAAGLTGEDPDALTGLGAGADSAVLARKRDVVAGAVARARAAVPGLDRDPLAALAQLGGPELAVLAGVVLGAAERRAVVVLDGFATSVAALVPVLLEPGVQACLVAGQRSRERGHALVLQQLGCEPLLDLRMRAGEGAGAALASGLLLDGLRVRRETARTDR